MITYEVAVYPDGDKYWFLKGKLHREDGPAIEFNDGTKKWFLNGELHREDGPAIEWGGSDKYWFFKSKRHREAGSKHWYLNGKPLTEEEFNTAWRMNHLGNRIPMKGGDEYDALTKARKFYLWKSGQLKRIKRAYNKRFRKQGKEIHDE